MRPLEMLIIAVALLMVTTCGGSPAPEALAGWDGPFYESHSLRMHLASSAFQRICRMLPRLCT